MENDLSEFYHQSTVPIASGIIFTRASICKNCSISVYFWFGKFGSKTIFVNHPNILQASANPFSVIRQLLETVFQCCIFVQCMSCYTDARAIANPKSNPKLKVRNFSYVTSKISHSCILLTTEVQPVWMNQINPWPIRISESSCQPVTTIYIVGIYCGLKYFVMPNPPQFLGLMYKSHPTKCEPC